MDGILVLAAACAAGAINAVAGGGTLMMVPTMIWLGYTHIHQMNGVKNLLH